ncbi:MAG TPA: class I SAM-dependent methyltransferase [Chthoniobacteraceae bacterium]|nr:class I SAM-dependent methyltransferase [Chthoniobacteraceae bacterium]
MNRIFKVIFGFNLASLVSLFKMKPMVFLRSCKTAFEGARNVDPVGIPEITLDEILGDRRPSIRMQVIPYEDGMLPSSQALALAAILVAEQPAEVLEIGTFIGNTTRLMAENAPNAIIHTVDLPEDFSAGSDPVANVPKDDFHLIQKRVVGKNYKDLPCASRIRQHFADTATWDFREAGHPVFFFIDGSHTYEYCKSDSEKCLELCGGRGVFLWHDYDRGHPGVVRFISEWRRKGRDIRRIAGTPLGYWKSS